MSFGNNPYVDEDGEPLMDPDAMAYRGASPAHALYDQEEDDDNWRRERSPTPVLDENRGGGKPRRRLVKKGGGERDSGSPEPFLGENLDDWTEEPSRTTKGVSKEWSKERGNGGNSKLERRRGKEEWVGTEQRLGYGGSSRNNGGESEINELWETIAGGDSEDDQDGVRNDADDAFIDDRGVDPADRYVSDNDDGYLRNAPQAEEDDEIDKMFKRKKRKRHERTPAEIAMIVENIMAELEVTAEEDAELNRQNKPAINKLKKLELLIRVLSKKNLQLEFLDHGVLTLLKNWLEPLPDGSLPNMNIRTAILTVLTDFPIDLEQYDRREQLKKSGLGKVIMFLSKTDEETAPNRRLAKDLVDKWSRPIFNKSTRFEDMRRFDDERVPFKRPNVKKSVTKVSTLEDNLDEFSQGPKSSKEAGRQHATRPEASPLDFMVRPQSKIDPDEIRARAKHQIQDQRRAKMNRRLQQLKGPKKKQLQATKISVEGRGLVRYL